MEHVSSRTPDHHAPEPSERNARGTLGWAAFLLIAMVAVAAVFAGAIHAKLSPPSPGVQPALSSAPSPAPSPLPRPGPAPHGTRLAGL
jgi:hypothetical protein